VFKITLLIFFSENGGLNTPEPVVAEAEATKEAQSDAEAGNQ
jgi:hypothetical protein